MLRLDILRDGKPSGRFELAGAGCAMILGRGEEADLKVEGDLLLSRKHAELVTVPEGVEVKRLPGSSNAIYHEGAPKDRFTVAPGGRFQIGKTTFVVAGDRVPAARPAADAPAPAAEAVEPAAAKPVPLETISAKELYALAGPTTGSRLRELLELPELLRSRKREGFYAHLAALLRSTTGGSWACVVSEEGRVLGEDAAGDSPNARPSRALARKAVSDSPQPTVYRWSDPQGLVATASAGHDWAVCAATTVPGEPAIVFYAAGRGGEAAELRDNARFAGLVADTVGRALSVDRLQGWQARLERFFAGPIVEKILDSDDQSALDSRLAQSTLMFFDIRGSSRRAEENNETLLGLVADMREAMTALTQIVLEERGVVLQYMGDGLLACWNVPFEEPDHVDRAVRAAARMGAALLGATGWRCGVGIHTGEVVAGALGSKQVFSYGVLGSVVNLASRLEGISKILETPVVFTKQVAEKLSPSVAIPMPIGSFKPAGMTAPVELFIPLPPHGDTARTKLFAEGLSLIKRGAFAEASRLFSSRPGGDGPAGFFAGLAAGYAASPPKDWSGVVALSSK